MLQILSPSFFNEPWAIALFIVVDIAVLTLIITLNYRFCAKRILDILLSLIALAVFFPFFIVLFAVQAIYNKKTNTYEKLFVKQYFIGKKQKIKFKTRFATTNSDGKVTKLGKFLIATKIAYYPRLFDVFAGRLSIVGPIPLNLSDFAAMKEDACVRFSVRAGLISSLERFGGEGLTYSDLFEEDADYVETRSLFKDVSFFFAYFLSRIRGDKRNKLGECAKKTYIQSLEDDEIITKTQASEYIEKGEKLLNEFLSEK